MSAINGIKNSSFGYVKHTFLDISINGQFESNKIFTIPHIKNSSSYLKNVFFFTFLQKRISIKILSKSVVIIGYKDNLKPLSFF